MINLQRSFGLLTAVFVAAVLAGCGGRGSTSPGYGALPGASQAGGKVAPDKCSHQHGVSVRPCRVTLTASQPTATVTAKGPSSGKFTVRDNRCKKNDIATISDQGSNEYLVTAGKKKGGCQVSFTDKDSHGNIIGRATLSVTNKP